VLLRNIIHTERNHVKAISQFTVLNDLVTGTLTIKVHMRGVDIDLSFYSYARSVELLDDILNFVDSGAK
jgi:hypothetical protein